jgi:hypothetical protein
VCWESSKACFKSESQLMLGMMYEMSEKKLWSSQGGRVRPFRSHGSSADNGDWRWDEDRQEIDL